MKRNTMQINYSIVCDTKEEYELFQRFTQEMKALKELRCRKDEWNGKCLCGHKHSDHHPISSNNYSDGHCIISECKCKYFNISNIT